MVVLTLLRTLVSRFLIIVLMAVYIPFFIAIALIPKEKLFKSRLFYFFGDIMYRLSLKCTLLPITFVGKENIPTDRPVIFAANHQSSLDIPLLGVLLTGRPHAWLAMSELMNSPILRWIAKAAVLVDTSSPLKSTKSLLKAIKLTSENKNMSIMIFPEGRRYIDGNVHDFFSGFVILAEKTGLPVVPVRIFGVNKAYPPKSFLIHWAPIKVVVGKPFVHQEGEDYEAFKNRVYDWFIQQRED